MFSGSHFRGRYQLRAALRASLPARGTTNHLAVRAEDQSRSVSNQASRHVGSYWQLPERLYDDPEELTGWARRRARRSGGVGQSVRRPRKRRRLQHEEAATTKKPAAPRKRRQEKDGKEKKNSS